ncbi:MAG TPA: ATP-binding protein [Chitinophagales bacterium]|nr:ATP-binding protein [Chitinophagales bacterium]
MTVSLVDINVDFEELVSKAEKFVERRKPEALPLAEEIMRYAIRNGNPRYYANAKYILAFYNCLVVNDYEKAIAYCQEVLHKLDESETFDMVYKIYMTMGNSYQLKGEIFLAQEAYLKGLKQLEAKKEHTSREKNFLGSFYYNLSLILSTTELNMPSEEYLEKAIAYYEEIDSSFNLSKSYVAYAGVFEKKKEYNKAIELLYKSLEIDIKINDPYSIALSKANLGIMHLRIRDFEQAFGYINDALAFFEESKMIYEKAMVRTNLGDALCMVDRRQDGIKELLASEDLFKKQDNKRELSNIYTLLSKYLAEEGDYKMALEYQQKYTESLKYFFDVEKTRALTRAKKEFESEQKEKEAALLREKNEEINHYVVRLESSNNELKQFAHVASHDLREPLRMITAYMNLLQKSMKDTLSPQQSEFMNYAVDGARRMEQLIIDMLRLAKVDANPHITAVNLNTVIEEISMNLELLIKDKNAMVIFSGLPTIMADRTMMLQLFQNLVGNGIKYNESGSPTIKLHHRIYRDALEISVTDNGIGIPEHLREKAFQLFQRLHTKKQYAGTGIGLAICKKIAESLGGKIAIEDNATGGSVFRIMLPLSVISKD